MANNDGRHTEVLSGPDDGTLWIDAHRRVWARKSFLRAYYTEQYFARVVAAMPPGPSLEIGAGPGFFAQYHRCSVVTDVAAAPHVDRVVDVHSMPFADGSFACVVGIDVAHHFHHPARGLSEIARVLRPGGRLILIEPWTGPVGYFLNKYVHTEDCFPIEDPWGPIFSGAKHAMEGNATIPKTLFADHADGLAARTGLRARAVKPFSILGFLATGGFTPWSLPMWAGRFLVGVDGALPAALMDFAAIKVFIVAERIDPELH